MKIHGNFRMPEAEAHSLARRERGGVHLDTLQNLTTPIVPENALRDVLVVLIEKAIDTTTVVDSVSYRLLAALNAVFTDSTYVSERVKDARWSLAQDSTLRHVAAQCPSEYGKAVYMARAAVGLYDTIPYSRVHECEVLDLPISARYGMDEESETTTSVNHMEPSLKCYPNPSVGEFYVSVQDSASVIWKLVITSPIGQVVDSRLLTNGQNRIDAKNLRPGIFLLQFYRGDVNFRNEKLIISQ